MESALAPAPALGRPAVGALRARFWPRRELLVPPALFLVATLFCWKLVYQGLVVIGYDTMTYIYPYRSYAAQAIRQGSVPLWNPYLYLGVPFLANLQAAVFYPLNAIFYLLPTPEAMNWSVVLHLFLAAYFTYLLARTALRVDRVSASMAGLVYAFGGFVGAQVGHLNQLNAAAWLPLLLVTAHLAWERRSSAWTIGSGLLIATQLLAGHAQESYMTLVAMGLYLAFAAGAAAVRARMGPALQWRSWLRFTAAAAARAGLIFATAAALGAGLAAVQLLPTNELTAHSIRAGGMAYGEAVSFSLPPRELFVGLLPHFTLAAPTSNEYIGYVGVVALALALLAVLFRLRQPGTLFFAGLAVLAFLLALGAHGPLYPRLFGIAPGLNLFRVPARWLMLNSLALAVLSGIGMSFLRDLGRRGWPDVAAGPWSRLGAASRLLAAITVLGPIAAWLGPLQRVAAGDQIAPLPANLLQLWGGVAAAAVTLAFAALAWAPSRWPTRLFAALALAELFVASRSLEYNNPNPREVYTTSRPTLEFLLADPEPYRVLSIAATGYHPSDAAEILAPYRSVLSSSGQLATLINTKYKEILSPNLPMAYGIATVDGYDGGLLPLRRYVEFKGLFVPRERNVPDALLRDQLRAAPPVGMLNLLGVKYVLHDRTGDLTGDGLRVAHESDVKIYRNDTTVPRAHLVYAAVLAADDAAALWALRSPVFDSASEVVLHESREAIAPAAQPGGRRARAGQLLRQTGRRILAILGVELRTDLGSISRDEAEGWGARPDADARRGARAGADQTWLSFAPPDRAAGRSASGHVEVLRMEAERMAFRVESPTAGLLVVHDSFYPGWVARMDGRPAPLLRANYLMKAVPVAAGSHTVEIVYRSVPFERGLLITSVSLGVALVGLLAASGSWILDVGFWTNRSHDSRSKIQDSK